MSMVSLLSACVLAKDLRTFRQIQDNIVSTDMNGKPTEEGRRELAALNWVRQYVATYSELPPPEVASKGFGFSAPADGAPAAYWLDRMVHRAFMDLAVRFGETIKPAFVRAEPSSGFLRAVQEFAAASAKVAVQSGIQHADETMRRVLDGMRRAALGIISPIKFGWPTMDRLTGGVGPGTLTTLAGRVGMGKTQLLVATALNAWLVQGKRVAFGSLELDDQQTGGRFAGLIAGYSHKHIRLAQLSSPAVEHMEKVLAQDWTKHPDMHFFYYTPDMRAGAVASVVEQFNPDVVYIDAAYRMKPTGWTNRMNGAEKGEAIENELKGIAQYGRIPIIKTLQLNRDSPSRRRSAESGEEDTAKRKKLSGDKIYGTDAPKQYAEVLALIDIGPSKKQNETRIIDLEKVRDDESNHEFTVNFNFNPPDCSEVVPESAEIPVDNFVSDE